MRGSAKIPFSIDAQFQADLYDRFIEKWNAGELNDELGEHSYVEVLQDTLDLRVEVEYIYQVQRRLFFRRLPLEEGAGIYNASTGTFTTRGFRVPAIDFVEVEAN